MKIQQPSCIFSRSTFDIKIYLYKYFNQHCSQWLYISAIFSCIFSIHCFSQNDVLVLKTDKEYYNLGQKTLTVFEDSTNSLELKEIEGKQFNHLEQALFISKNPNVTYWVRLQLVDSSTFLHDWYFISYNFNLDSLQIYGVWDQRVQIYEEYKSNFTKFSQKSIKHKSPSFDLPIPKNVPVVIYFKIRNSQPFQYGLAIREHEQFFNSSVLEYYWYGLFYGGIIMIALYHLSFFIGLRDFSYLFYFLYILTQGLYMSFRDGSISFSLFPEHPHLIWPTYNLVMFMLSITMLLYARFFLQLKNYKWFDKILVSYSLVRLLFLLVFKEYHNGIMWLDLMPMVISFVFAVVSIRQGYTTSILFCFSFGILIFGHLINLLWHNNIIEATAEMFYSLYYAVGIESLLLAIANAFRLRQLKTNLMVTEEVKTILELRVNEGMDKIKVQEQLIKKKGDELDTFLYRASHDIRGPLKSIEGLAQIGKLDTDLIQKDECFDHIYSSSKRLVSILNNLVEIAKLNRQELHLEEVGLKDLVEECISHFKEYPGFEAMHFEIIVNNTDIIETERYSLFSIIQNMVENAIKYRDSNKTENHLQIKLEKTSSSYILVFVDNGLGINKGYIDKIFQMFYRANSDSTNGAGLGLFIVKQSIERLKGSIELSSEEGVFTKFVVTLPTKYFI